MEPILTSSKLNRALRRFQTILDPFIQQVHQPDRDGFIVDELYHVGKIGAPHRLIICQRALFYATGKKLYRIDYHNLRLTPKLNPDQLVTAIYLSDGTGHKPIEFFSGQLTRGRSAGISFHLLATHALYLYLQNLIDFVQHAAGHFRSNDIIIYYPVNDRLRPQDYAQFGQQEKLILEDHSSTLTIIAAATSRYPYEQVRLKLLSDGRLFCIHLDTGDAIYYIAGWSGGDVSNPHTLDLYQALLPGAPVQPEPSPWPLLTMREINDANDRQNTLIAALLILIVGIGIVLFEFFTPTDYTLTSYSTPTDEPGVPFILIGAGMIALAILLTLSYLWRTWRAKD